eukprot:11014209-Lingulodinium_polyedra.AAC.1
MKEPKGAPAVPARCGAADDKAKELAAVEEEALGDQHGAGGNGAVEEAGEAATAAPTPAAEGPKDQT